MLWLDSVPPAVPGRALSFEEKQGILVFAQRYPLLGPARAEEIAAPLAKSLHGPVSPAEAAGRGSPPVSSAVAADHDPVENGGNAAYLLGIARTFAGSADGGKP
jgi:hypothetical protein